MPTAENQASLVEVYKEKATATACQVAEFSSFEEIGRASCRERV